MTFEEKIIKQCYTAIREKDKFFTQRVYGIEVDTIKGSKKPEEVFKIYLELVNSFDQKKRGYVIFCKNYMSKEIVRVNL